MYGGSENDQLLKTVAEIREIRSLKATVQSSVKSGVLVGVAATVGGLFLGPRGIAIGSLLAGAGASFLMEGQFKSVPKILMDETTADQKNQLSRMLWKLLNEKNIFNVATLLLSLQSGRIEPLIAQIVQIVANYLTSDMGYKISN